ncbi:hypothetical protein BCV69DRAFT_253416 [Microstroma glucosiphilum]|uniref:Tc1-like transposase DDE domain-containing protein n=1 Tax=Pseudomicrostroma glucosiphilum TaxID=1684307 RepID=A0A316U0L9_9BASI|nr:hypothetical protein BCV69DRAFT_253416 [Pseudomicrostroma glucosiphilum]PWN18033.1 hypothetical protein BCV69DRAFT_253416 [Pseudomicrostroma glucosiphilum]
MRAVDEELLSLGQCVYLGAYSWPTAQRLRFQWLGHDRSLAPRKTGGDLGRPRRMNKAAAYQLLSLIKEQPDAQLSELSKALFDLGYGYFSTPYLCKATRRLNVSYKVANCYATARSDLQRLEYRHMIKYYDPEQLVFIDESAFDYRVCNRKRARSTKGRLAYLRQPFQRGNRLSFMPACSLTKGCFAYYTKTGSVNGEVFLHYLREVLLPQMSEVPLANSVIVCDNASIHKVPGVLDLVHSQSECQEAAAGQHTT